MFSCEPLYEVWRLVVIFHETKSVQNLRLTGFSKFWIFFVEGNPRKTKGPQPKKQRPPQNRKQTP